MTTPLETYDLPDIDEQLSDNESYRDPDAQEAKTYEKSPLKETGPPENHLTKTESLSELERQITKGKVPHRDVVNPTGHEQDALFPEEYQVETETGLVRSTTALSLQKSRPRQNSSHNEDEDTGTGSIPFSGLTKEKLDKAVEKNRRALEKQKNGKGFFHKLKTIFT